MSSWKLEIFLANDQPTTCPKCGSRTFIFFDLSHSISGTQIHECLDKGCKFIFVTEEDEEFFLELEEQNKLDGLI
jgi:hypothetical protein